MAESNGLLNRRLRFSGPRVRIPTSPPCRSRATWLRQAPSQPFVKKITLALSLPTTLLNRSQLMWYFYVLQSETHPDYFYKGSTNDLRRRLEQHNQGLVASTKPYHPLRLVYYEAYLKEFAARCRESSVKKSGSVSTPLLRRINETLD